MPNKPLPPTLIGCSRKNLEDLAYAFFSQRYQMPPKDQLTFKWTGFEYELEIRKKEPPIVLKDIY